MDSIILQLQRLELQSPRSKRLELIESANSHSTLLLQPLLLTKLPPKIRHLIYSILVSEKSFYPVINVPVLAPWFIHSAREGSISRFARTCKSIKQDIEDWYSLGHANLGVLPQLGIFNLSTTTSSFNLSALYGDGDRELALQESHFLAEEQCNRFYKHDAFQHIRNLELSLPQFYYTSRKNSVLLIYGQFLENLRDMKSLQSVNFLIQCPYDFKIETGASLWVPAGQRIVAIALWNTFWDNAAFCHPARCCTCCSDLPELTISFRNMERVEQYRQKLPGFFMDASLDIYYVLPRDFRGQKGWYMEQWYKTIKEMYEALYART
jgi:hypothetical protein